MKTLKGFPAEALVWLAGLIVLAIADPAIDGGTVCPLHNLGLNFCPGCGLGRSVSWLFHGSIKESWNTHPLGIPAVLILTGRIISLTKTYLSYGKNH